MKFSSIFFAAAGSLAVGTYVQPSLACTNILVAKGATADNSTMITYVADSHTLYGELPVRPAALYPTGAMTDIIDVDSGKFIGQIPQVARTHSVVGLMNEYQVSIGETTFGGRSELFDPVGGIDYGSLMVLALQRSTTAVQAIHVMTELAEQYGYASEGETFSVADPKEVWLLEMVGKGPSGHGALWVARRVPEGMVSAHANQSRIRQFPQNDPANALFAKDVISFARSKGYFSGRDSEFSFADAYHPLAAETLRACEARVWSVFRRVAPSLKLSSDFIMGVEGAKPLPLWVKPDKKLSTADVMALMRDHFEGTELDLSHGVGAGPFHLPYRWRPLDWELNGIKYVNERAISTQQTGFSFVAQMREQLPNPIGGVLWFGVDDTYSTVYVPMYAGLLAAPKNYAPGVASLHHFSWDSAFWVFNWVANFAYSRYQDMIVDIQKVQRDLEGGFLAQQADVEQKALALYKSSAKEARDFLTQYSMAQAERVVTRWRTLGEELLVKYLDGNVKDEAGKVLHPPYPKDWYERIVAEQGEHFKVRHLKSEPDSFKPLTITGYFHSKEELGDWAKQVPNDVAFGKEKLVYVAGEDKCSRPPQCCLLPKLDNATHKLVVEPPESPKNPCGPSSWLVRVSADEKRPLYTKAAEH
jgi:dipeptidase